MTTDEKIVSTLHVSGQSIPSSLRHKRQPHCWNFTGGRVYKRLTKDCEAAVTKFPFVLATAAGPMPACTDNDLRRLCRLGADCSDGLMRKGVNHDATCGRLQPNGNGLGDNK